MRYRNEIMDQIQGPFAKSYVVDNFAKYAKSGTVSRFLCRYELMKLILHVKGSICECGLKTGNGMFEWWHLSKLLDPNDRRRQVIGFDTFEGFPSVSEKDGPVPKVGDLAMPINTYEEILGCIEAQEHDECVFTSGTDLKEEENRGQWGKAYPGSRMAPVKGDFMETGPKFVKEWPHLVLALLFLDFDLYEPTKLALELFLPRMPKGAILVFDELNNVEYPGETLAVMETLGLPNLRLRKFQCNRDVSYVVL